METEPQVRACELGPEIKKNCKIRQRQGQEQWLRLGRGMRRMFCVCRGELEPAVMGRREGKLCRTMGHGKDPGTCQDGADTAPGFPFWEPKPCSSRDRLEQHLTQPLCSEFVSVWPLHLPWEGGTPQGDSQNT